MINSDNLLYVAKEAAMEAGKIQLSFFCKTKEILFKSSEFDLVTNADKAAEDRIIAVIKEAFPTHEILAEESGVVGNNESDYVWVIDPIDGTTNYAHNFPHFSVSIGLLYKGEPYLGVVYDVCKKEMFWAVKNMGAYLNDTPIRISNITSLRKSLLATGFPCSDNDLVEENLKYFKKFIYESQAVRRPGAASLDLCYVACGRLDGFWEMNLAPWDVAAGVCIVREAGGRVTNFGVADFNISIKNILASNDFIHSKMDLIIQSLQTKV